MSYFTCSTPIVVSSPLTFCDFRKASGLDDSTTIAVNTQLNRLMMQLNPIQIFLTGDTEIFLKRAITDRGENWARHLSPERCNSDDIRNLTAYFNEMREIASELLAEWPFKKIVLDTTKHDLLTCATEILRHLDVHANLHMDICKASENA